MVICERVCFFKRDQELQEEFMHFVRTISSQSQCDQCVVSGARRDISASVLFCMCVTEWTVALL